MGLSQDPEKRSRQLANLRKANPLIPQDVPPKPKPVRKPLEVMDYDQQPPKPAKAARPRAPRKQPAAARPPARRQPAARRERPPERRGAFAEFIDGLLGR